MAKKRVVHYINQFYAGMGGEDTASVGLSTQEGPVGPGALLQKCLGDDYEIVETIICGDNTIAERPKEILPQVVDEVKKAQADLFVAGPGFNAGRYGLGCGSTVAAVTEEIGIPAVTALFAENPGTDLYKNRGYILQSDNNAAHMRKMMKTLAAFAKRLVDGDTIKDGHTEGYHGSGPAPKIDYSIPAAKRGIDMLLAKYAGKPFHTEVIMPNHEQIPVPTLGKPLSECKVALVTDGGLVPKGNPDNQPPTNSRAFKEYSIAGMDTLNPEDWEVSHQGYDNSFVLQDPNRLVPVDAVRKLVSEGKVGALNDSFFSTAGVMTPMEKCKAFGEGIAQKLKEEGVDAVIETST
jgi:glycine reductase